MIFERRPSCTSSEVRHLRVIRGNGGRGETGEGRKTDGDGDGEDKTKMLLVSLMKTCD